MYSSIDIVDNMFSYHPPTNEERIRKHEAINNASLEFATVLFYTINDPVLRDQAINAVQYARMIANQMVTYEDIYAGDNK